MTMASGDQFPEAHGGSSRHIISAWAAAHGLTWRWGGAVLLSWAAVSLFAAITIPVKYPYEAAGTVIDSGVIVGMIVPVSITGTVLFEGPPYMVRAAAQDLLTPRLVLLVGVYTLTSLAALVTAIIASLPLAIVVVDAMLLVSLLVLGVSMIGVGLGWIVPAFCTLVFSAPGLVPWNYNALYHRSVSDLYIAVVVGVSGLGMAAYSLAGSRDRLVNIHMHG